MRALKTNGVVLKGTTVAWKRFRVNSITLDLRELLDFVSFMHSDVLRFLETRNEPKALHQGRQRENF